MWSLLFIPALHAAELLVPQEQPDLAAAMAVAVDGDLILIDPSALDVDGNAYDVGDAVPATTLSVTVRGVTASPAPIPAMSFYNGGVGTLENVAPVGRLSSSWDTDDDGVAEDVPLSLLAHSGGKLVLIDVLLDADAGSHSLGAFDGDLEATRLQAWNFEDNRPIYAFGNTRGVSVTLEQVALTDNAAGAILIDGKFANTLQSANLIIQGGADGTPSLLARNSAELGAGVLGRDLSVVVISDAELRANAASTRGGALHINSFEQLILDDVLISGYDEDGVGEPVPSRVAPGVALLGEDGAGASATFRELRLTGLYSERQEAGGGAILAQNVDLVIEGLEASGLSSGGGSLLDLRQGSLRAADMVVQDFQPPANGALILLTEVSPPSSGFTIQRAVFCGGEGASGAEALVLGATDSEVSVVQSVLHFIAGDAPLLRAQSGSLTLTHNSFVYNPDTTLVSVEGGAQVELVNNLLQGAALGVSVQGADSSASGDSNLWHGLEAYEEGAALPGQSALYEDPGIWTGFMEGDCDGRPYLGEGSPAINAGQVTGLLGLDEDGSLPDIGAYGGQDAESPPDADGDGYSVLVDCDDGDAEVNPGAEELPGDGIDNDCDGEDAVDTGVTDDTAATEDSATPEDTGAPRVRFALSGGCASAGGRGRVGLGLLVALALLARRRAGA